MDMVIFRPLGHAQMIQILDLRIEELVKLLEDRQISLELTEPARQLILAAGWDPVYGARPLKRALQRMVQDPLAMKILDGEVLHGRSCPHRCGPAVEPTGSFGRPWGVKPWRSLHLRWGPVWGLESASLLALFASLPTVHCPLVADISVTTEISDIIDLWFSPRPRPRIHPPLG